METETETRNSIQPLYNGDGTYENERVCFLLFCLRFTGSKTSFEKKNCFSAWASTLNMGLINKVDMVCLSPVGYGV